MENTSEVTPVAKKNLSVGYWFRNMGARAKTTLLFVVASLLLLPVVVVAQNWVNLDIRNQAASADAPVSIEFSSTNANFPTNQSSSIQIVANTGQATVDGFQVFATLSGAIPSDIQFNPSSVSGLKFVRGGIGNANRNGNRVLSFAFVTENPTQPYTSAGQNVVLGTLNFTPTSAGQLSITANKTKSKSIAHGSLAAVLSPIVSKTFTVTASNPTPTVVSSPVASPSNIPNPTGQLTINIVDPVANVKISSRNNTRFQAVVFDPKVGTYNGAGVKGVEFEITKGSQSLYKHGETDAVYCAFLDVDFLCQNMPSSLYSTLSNGTYTLKVKATAVNGVVAEKNVSFEITNSTKATSTKSLWSVFTNR